MSALSAGLFGRKWNNLRVMIEITTEQEDPGDSGATDSTCNMESLYVLYW